MSILDGMGIGNIENICIRMKESGVGPTENQSAQLETPDGFVEQMYVWLMFSRFSRGDDSDDIPL